MNGVHWDGVGYITNKPGVYTGYIISGGLSGRSEDIHGGYTSGTPLSFDPVVPKTVLNTTQTYAGDPINMATGSLIHDETDLRFPSLGAPLQFSRHYDSDHTDQTEFTSDRGLSDGWSFTYSDRLETDGNDRIWFTDGGDRLRFVYDSGAYTTPDSIYGMLVNNGTGLGYTWTDKTGSKTHFDDSGRLTGREDRYGNGISVTYDVSGHIDRATDLQAAGRYLDFTYTGDLVTTISDFTGRNWTYQYDSNSRLWKVTAPFDASTPTAIVQYEYYTDTARDGLLKKIVDPNGEETNFTYYANRRGFAVTDASGNTQSVAYNIFRDRTAFTNELGAITYYTFDDTTGSVTEEMYDDRTTVEFTWQNGERTSRTDAFGQTESYQYDSDGNITQLTDRAGYVTTYTYTDYANVETVTVAGDPGTTLDNQVTTYRYFTDAQSKDSGLKEVEDTLGKLTSYTYPATNRGLPATMTSPRGNATTGDPNDFVTTYTYNTAGQRESTTVRVSATDSITVTSHYDSRGNRDYAIDGEGNRTDYQYDLANRPRVEWLPLNDGVRQQNVFTYNAMGSRYQVATVVPETTLRIISSEYDEMQRVLKVVNVDGTYTLNQYDRIGNLAARTDELGRVTRFRQRRRRDPGRRRFRR